MTTKEFSDAFDTLLNSYNNQAMFGETSSRADITLDEYEKSIFLTLAQDLIIKLYFEKTSANVGFDESERRLIDFSSLIRVAEPLRYTENSSEWTIGKTYAANMPCSVLGEGTSYLFILVNINVLAENTKNTITSNSDKSALVLAGPNLGGYVINFNIPYGVSPKNYFTKIKDAGSRDTITLTLNAEKDEGIVFTTTLDLDNNYITLFTLDVVLGQDTYGSGGLRTETITYTMTSNRGAGASYDERGILYKLPTTSNGNSSILFMLNEKFLVTSRDRTLNFNTLSSNTLNVTKTYIIKPISYREYDREMSKAYSLPLKKLCWRLFLNSTGIDIVSEIIPIVGSTLNTEFKYRIRYVERPTPIILTTLPEDLEIDGYRDVMECALNPILHMDILNKAIELVLSTRGGRTSLKLHNTATKSQE